jgi:hypothetical protein
MQFKNVSKHSAMGKPPHFSMEKEDSGLSGSFFAKGMEEAVISVGIYCAHHSRQIVVQFCSTVFLASA